MCIRLKRHNDIIICHVPLKARIYLSQRDRRRDMEKKGSITHRPPLEIETIWSKLFGPFPVMLLMIKVRRELK